MSKRVINPNQLQMFMKPSEIRRQLTGSVDQQPVADPTKDWEGKKTTHLKTRIAEEGVRDPVILDHGEKAAGMDRSIFSKEPLPKNPVSMGNGHHRLQAAKELEDEGREIYVPVLHTDDDFMAHKVRWNGVYPDLTG